MTTNQLELLANRIFSDKFRVHASARCGNDTTITLVDKGSGAANSFTISSEDERTQEQIFVDFLYMRDELTR